MMTPQSGPAPSGNVSGGAFDDLPGGPWKTPPHGDFSGFAVPAIIAMTEYAADEVGEAACKLGGVELTVRVIDPIQDSTNRTVRIFQFIADEFEVLILSSDDMVSMHIAFRGSELAFARAAGLLLARGK